MNLYFCDICHTTEHAFETPCPYEGLCRFCKTRKATIHWGDMLSFTHGGGENCCDLCAARMQLTHAQERAAAIPDLEARVRALEGAGGGGDDR